MLDRTSSKRPKQSMSRAVSGLTLIQRLCANHRRSRNQFVLREFASGPSRFAAQRLLSGKRRRSSLSKL